MNKDCQGNQPNKMEGEKEMIEERNGISDGVVGDKKEKNIIYYVNAEKFETYKKKITVRDILEKASFAPAENYWLIRDNGNKKLENYEEEMHIHHEESFTAVFKEQTPVSER